MRPPDVAQNQIVNGYTALGEKPGRKGGRYFVAASGSRGMTTEEQERHERTKRDRELKAARELEALLYRGRTWWDQAAGDAAPAAAYFAARGVPLDGLPAALFGETIRFHPALPCFAEDGAEVKPGPAVLLAVTKSGGSFHTLHRIYLALDGSPSKRTGDIDNPKKAWADIGGKSIKMSRVAGAMTLVRCEGPETGAMILAASPLEPELAWDVECCISGAGMIEVETDPAKFGPGGYQRLVYAGDLDDWATSRNDRPGHSYANTAAAKARGVVAGVRVDVAIPGHRDCPDLVNEAGQPKTEAGCDWLDVGRARPNQVRLGILLAAGDALQPPIADWEIAAGKGSGTRASQPARPDKGGFVGTRASQSGGGDDEDDGDSQTRGAEAVEEKVKENEADDVWDKRGFWVTTKGRPLLPAGDIQRARILLWLHYMPPKPEGERFTLAYWPTAKQWFEWTGTHYKPVLDDELAGRALKQFAKWMKRKATGDLVSSALSHAQCVGIVSAMQAECSVDMLRMPHWAPPTIDEKGVPLFAGDVEAPKPGGKYGRNVKSFKNGLLDLETLRVSTRVEMGSHTPLLLIASSMPYDLPVDDINEELQADPRGEFRGGPLCARLAPSFTKWILDCAREDEEYPRAFQQMLGRPLDPTLKLENLHYLLSLPGTGKGTTLLVCKLMHGPDVVASSSLNAICRPFGLEPLLNKDVVFFDEVSAGNSTDLLEATRVLLSLTGGAPQPVDMKHIRGAASVEFNASIIMTGNKIQKLADAAGAMARRMIVIKLPKLYQGQIPDPNFKRRIAAEAPGICVWALFGLMDLWRTNAFVQPNSGLKQRELFLRMSARSKAFMDDCCVVDAGASCSAKLMFEMFNAWSDANGFRSLQMEEFTADVCSCVDDFDYDSMMVGGRTLRIWHGIRPRLLIDAKDRSTWTGAEQTAATSTILGDGRIVRRLAGHVSDDQHAAAAFAKFEFDMPSEEEREDQSAFRV